MTKYIESSNCCNLEEVYSNNIEPNLNNIETLMDGDLYASKKRDSKKKSKTHAKKTTDGESSSDSKRIKLTTPKKKSMKKTSVNKNAERKKNKNGQIELMIDNKLKIIENALSEIRKLMLMPEFAEDIINMDSRVTCSNIDEDCL